MPIRGKKEKFTVPGTVIECKSGRFLAYYEHRTDIIANGVSEIEAKKNLKQLFAIVKKNEDGDCPPPAVKLPVKVKTKKFVERLQEM